MPKRSSYDIKRKILTFVKEKPATYAQLERKVNTGYRTIRQNCEELEHFDQIIIKTAPHPANGKEAHVVSITPEGLEVLKKKEK